MNAVLGGRGRWLGTRTPSRAVAYGAARRAAVGVVGGDLDELDAIAAGLEARVRALAELDERVAGLERAVGRAFAEPWGRPSPPAVASELAALTVGASDVAALVADTAAALRAADAPRTVVTVDGLLVGAEGVVGPLGAVDDLLRAPEPTARGWGAGLRLHGPTAARLWGRTVGASTTAARVDGAVRLGATGVRVAGRALGPVGVVASGLGLGAAIDEGDTEEVVLSTVELAATALVLTSTIGAPVGAVVVLGVLAYRHRDRIAGWGRATGRGIAEVGRGAVEHATAPLRWVADSSLVEGARELLLGSG